jgi:hypothetical protein
MEIRIMILEALVQQKHPGWPSLASVCQEWQLVIASRSLRQLKLQMSCLDGLGRLIVRRRHLVHHIRFEIELPRYTCRCCNREVSLTVTKHDNSIISEGIWELFHVLSSWNLEEQTRIASGLVLELNVYCPSDSKHLVQKVIISPSMTIKTTEAQMMTAVA